MHTSRANDDRVLSDADAERVIDKVVQFCSKDDELIVRVQSLWYGAQRWARNRAFQTNNVRKVEVRIIRTNGYQANSGRIEIGLNQIDDTSLRDACAFVEQEINHKYEASFRQVFDLKLGRPTWESKGIPVWSDTTYNRTATENAQLVTSMTERAEADGMMSSGSIDTAAAHFMGYKRDGWGREVRETGHATMAECSTTVRHPKGVGSGWAGASSFDLKRLDLAKLGDLAFDKCLRSLNPVRIEPGRYQTILEPQATADFAIKFFELFGRREGAETRGPIFLGYDAAINRGMSKLGLQIADRRLRMSHDPEDPITGSHSYPAVQKVDFLKDGVLTAMGYEYADYSLPQLESSEPVLSRTSFAMTSTEITSVDDMIATTKRGLLLTRVSGMEIVDEPSALYTGLTRDGLWLIENGKITKAVRNFRWTESPMFIFNNVESVGESVPIMNSWYQQFPFPHGSLHRVVPSVVVPTIKINDFSFTSTIDAV